VWENPSQAIEIYLKFMIHVMASTPATLRLEVWGYIKVDAQRLAAGFEYGSAATFALLLL
jgi:hypothetical protein